MNTFNLKKQFKVIAVLPAYNAAKTLHSTLQDIPEDWIDDIVLVDDCSQDQTVTKAKELGIKHIVVHKENKGYGANQKTCYRKALELGADIVIMIHPDHQYNPKYVPEMLLPIMRGDTDAVFGSRMMIPGSALKGGMPYWKYITNRLLTALANFVLGLRLTELHSGYRAYSKKVLKTLPLEKNSDQFVFDTEIIIQLKNYNFRIIEIPIETRYFKDASSVGFNRQGIAYGLGILKALGIYLFKKLKHIGG